MSVKTFISFFFFLGLIRALTSGRLQKILAWDAAKIAISASSAKINSIETQKKNETPLKIKDRKNNRCFLLYLPNKLVLNVKDRKDEGKKIREARSHLKAIMKSIGMWCQNN